METAESKKYWYIQLNVNFFDDERIDWLCEQKNGYAYVVLYLKLCLKTANNNGILTRQIGDMIIPYNIDKIAEITKMNVDIVRVALELYKSIGLIYESDAECSYMRLPEVPNMVGYTTQYAIDKAKQRERNKQKSLPEPYDSEQDIVQDNVLDNVQQELRVKSKELRVKSKKKNKEGNSVKNTEIPSTEELQTRFSSTALAESVHDWLLYKQERKEGYQATGLKSLLTQIENKVKKHGECAVISVITLSMSNGWKGILWEKIEDKPNGANDISRTYQKSQLNVTRF